MPGNVWLDDKSNIACWVGRCTDEKELVDPSCNCGYGSSVLWKMFRVLGMKRFVVQAVKMKNSRMLMVVIMIWGSSSCSCSFSP